MDSKRVTTPSRRWWVMSVEDPLETPNCVGKNSVDRKIQSGNMRLTANSWSFLHLKKRKTMEKSHNYRLGSPRFLPPTVDIRRDMPAWWRQELGWRPCRTSRQARTSYPASSHPASQAVAESSDYIHVCMDHSDIRRSNMLYKRK